MGQFEQPSMMNWTGYSYSCRREKNEKNEKIICSFNYKKDKKFSSCMIPHWDPTGIDPDNRILQYAILYIRCSGAFTVI